MKDSELKQYVNGGAWKGTTEKNPRREEEEEEDAFVGTQNIRR